MLKQLLFVLIITTLNFAQTNYSDINELIHRGNFSKAQEMIELKIAEGNISAQEKYDLQFQIIRMDRIRKDFTKTKENILNYVKKYYPNIKEADLEKWEKDGSLEYKIIDGKKYFFDRAAGNLFRINKAAKARKIEVDGNIKDEQDTFLENYLTEVVQQSKSLNAPFVNEKRMRLSYNLTVKADAVPDGEIIRSWLPFPREKGSRQKDVKLISINNDSFIISPEEYSHRTIYSEQTAQKGKSTEFKLVVEFTGVNEWHKLDNGKLKPYNKNSETYNTFIAERPPHIVFTDRVKKLSVEIVGDEENPILIAKKIFKWINDNIPWAGAREYSTIQNISDYCLSTGHGDCGIKTLTFITLVRYNGIPARWESGLMLHPNSWNLHDWGEVYFEGIGWVPVDQSFGLNDS
ncbi:MAG: transglutaminase-like domain-containing protein, partial [Bacteroidota bacterium]